MKIAFVGSGYVGLVSGACFADFGHDVVCIDNDQSKIDRLREGVMPIYEPGLDALVETNVKAGRLSFTTALAEGIKGADAIFICVGTPSRRGDGHADLTFVYEVARKVGESLVGDAVVVTKSTVPVGTGDEVERIIQSTGTVHKVAVVSNPEFLREGSAIGDFRRPDRIVIGAEDEFGREVMRELYRPMFLNESPILFTLRRTSELIKYAANAFLATKITFINEMADLCEKVGANVQDVSRGIGMDNRIGSKFLQAGPGYGGSCFPKDTLALLKTAEDYGSVTRIVEAVVKVNESRKRAMGRKVISALGGLPMARGKKVAMLGLTFKPDTDDMRDSPSIAIAQTLADAGLRLAAYDPAGMKRAAALMPEVTMCDNAFSALEDAHAVVVVTEWKEFQAIDFSKIKFADTQIPIIDLRNTLNEVQLGEMGFTYIGIGAAKIPNPLSH